MNADEARILITDTSMYPRDLFFPSYAATHDACVRWCRDNGVELVEKGRWSLSPDTSTTTPTGIRLRRGFWGLDKLDQVEILIHEITHVRDANSLRWWSDYALRAWWLVVGESRARGAVIAFRVFVKPHLANTWALESVKAIGPHLREAYFTPRILNHADTDAAIVAGLTEALGLAPSGPPGNMPI